MKVWGDILQILDQLNDSSIIEAGSAVETHQMLSDFHTVSKLKVELAALVDGAQPFLKACYTLEGNGPLAFSVYDEIKQCENFIVSPHLPNLLAVCGDLGGNNMPRTQ